MAKYLLALVALTLVFVVACSKDIEPPAIVKPDETSQPIDIEFENFLASNGSKGQLQKYLDKLVKLHFVSEKRLKEFESQLDKNSNKISESEAWKDLQVFKEIKESKTKKIQNYYMRLIKLAATKRPNQRVSQARKIITNFEDHLQDISISAEKRVGLVDIGITLRKSLEEYYKFERHWSEDGVSKILNKRLGKELMSLISPAEAFGDLAESSANKLSKKDKKELESMDAELKKEFKKVKARFFAKP